ncbi:amino acid ABC transporter substrate-binding protein [Shivajiella indica]|uniref:Amino acid ABC transporter substrate-binding protein n=1 Tax=Shivajiella indica TaxID=872115 RepID=A0ABW5B5X2_9BACT
MRIIILLIFVISIFFNPSIAQDELATYKRAKTLISYGNYDDAMELLRPYMDASQFGNLSYYASYHFAQAAYQKGSYKLSQSIITDLANNSTWPKQDESRYLLALTLFQEGRNFEALQEISKINSPKVKSQAENATYNFLKQTSVSFLAANLRQFNENKGYVLALKEQMERLSVMSNDERVVYNQIKDFSIASDKQNNSPSKNLESLDIALILPLNYSGGKGVKNLEANNFVFELYQGIRFAAKELKESGLNLNIKTFDTERDLNKVRNILADPFILKSDIIIGPIYPDESEMVMAFAERNSIPFINPLSNINDKLQGTAYSYLFRPSVNSIADSILEFSFKNLTGKRMAIAYSSGTRDEQLANLLVQQAGKFGYSIARNQKVVGREILDFFEKVNLKNPETVLADFVIVLTDDPNTASITLGFMESQNINTPVLVMDSWLYFNFANYEMLENQNFYFIGNNPIDFGSQNLLDFREKFNLENINYPSFNSHLGYELMNWISQTINPNKGFDFRRNLDQNAFTVGKITYGFNFLDSNNNTYVPIFKIGEGYFEIN